MWTRLLIAVISVDLVGYASRALSTELTVEASGPQISRNGFGLEELIEEERKHLLAVVSALLTVAELRGWNYARHWLAETRPESGGAPAANLVLEDGTHGSNRPISIHGLGG